MHALVELEIIRSALLSGEVNDALSRISRKRKRAERLFSLTKKEKYAAIVELLDRVHGAIVDGADTDKIMKCLPSLEKAGFVQFGHDQAEQYLKNLIYYITIMKDRYEISKQGFDAKRCGDL